MGGDSDVYVVYAVRTTATVCAAVASATSFMLISKHLNNFNHPFLQSKIVEAALFIDMARDCYEAYVLYLFFALLLGYVGNGDEYALIAALESEAMSAHINLTSSGGSSGSKMKKLGKHMSLDPKDGEKFIRYCRFGTLQYCLVRPVTTILAGILSLCGVYHESELDPRFGYFWLMLVLNLSVMQALFALVTFYNTMKSRLEEFDPLPKFLCVKAIIFFAFWQGLAIMLLVEVGAIDSLGPYKEDVVATVLQDLLISVEMPLIAIAHIYAFPVDPFSEGVGSVDSGYISARPLNNKHSGRRNIDNEFGKMNEPLLTGSRGHGRHGGHLSVMMQSTARTSTNPFDDEDETDRSDPMASVRSKATFSSTWGSSVGDFLRRNFAYNEAIRDFNSSMPVISIPSGFDPQKGESIPSKAKWRADIR